MKKIIYIFLLVLFCQLTVYGQKETSWWHFGYNSGLNFNSLSNAKASDGTVVTNMPTPIVGSLSTSEGCFTVSTYDGKLLFSSDGSIVYDKNGNPMINGSGLLGGNSATQSGIAIPKPGSLTEYYVVTVPPDYTNFPDGIRYSVVDLSKREGLGEVVLATKNSLIKAGAVYENIAAVPNANGKDYWLLHRSSGEFYVWAITVAGISTTPHQKLASTLIPSVANSHVGELILSDDHTKLAAATYIARTVVTAKFDSSTGLISDLRSNTLPASTYPEPYGVTFSPNSDYLYVTTGYNDNGLLYVGKWDALRAGGAFTYLTDKISNLKKGVDNRLYGIHSYRRTAPLTGFARTRNLSVVLNPDQGGTNIKFFPDFLINDAYLGLPTFAAGFIRIIPKERPFACTANDRTYIVEVDLTGGNAPARLEWNFGDGTPIVSQAVITTQNKQPQNHKYNKSGVYTITVTPYKGDGTMLDIVIMQANIVDCTLKSNRMTRSELLNSRQMMN
ncbi:hypothetical protein CLV62_101316 [Dysgonomonas alginatilytica]|uniref:PKD domain-containing protein n=1 Tax=Dysgonomonas alginatilytica TaxID=1605892 RepID=A0A2V3PTJ1_9BACT|nr:PKD domain-containing protein [Dysgonomonas alginatilytica]PXV69047.1 hypothetical protein CLV62_101316 [Dysgonomonas alginatilytica]